MYSFGLPRKNPFERSMTLELLMYLMLYRPLLMQLSTFIGFILLSGEPLTSSRVYTSIALFNMLISPLNAFPWVVNGVIDGIVSTRRLEKLFRLDQFKFCSLFRRDVIPVPRSKYFCEEIHSPDATDSIFISGSTVCSYPRALESTGDPFKIHLPNRLNIRRGNNQVPIHLVIKQCLLKVHLSP